MAKFIEQEEAAKTLGITVEQLTELRTDNEIRGFRDGGTWKFRDEDIDAIKPTVLQTLKKRAAGESDLGLAEETPGEGSGGDSVLLSERELGQSGIGKSTIIGNEVSGDPSSATSDVKLAEESDIMLDQPASGTGSGSGKPGSDLGLQFEELDSLELELDEGSEVTSGSGSPGKSDIGLGADSDLSLSGEDDLDLGSGTGGSTLDIGGDDDLVLGGSGSDVTSNAGDSGIQLLDPSDSGLSLDAEPVELGSSIVDHLELGEEDMVTLGGGDSGLSAATQLKADDDFMLTPLEGAEDESESGSQVIALDTTEGTDLTGATTLGMGAGMAMLEEDAADAGLPAGLPGAQQTLMMPAAAIPEAPYSIWNVLSLFVCILMLCMTGMIMFDLVRNIWSWDQAYPVNSSLMDAIVSIFDK